MCGIVVVPVLLTSCSKSHTGKAVCLPFQVVTVPGVPCLHSRTRRSAGEYVSQGQRRAEGLAVSPAAQQGHVLAREDILQDPYPLEVRPKEYVAESFAQA